jgi:formylglycine-generating enzyme required for sulfatase activity
MMTPRLLVCLGKAALKAALKAVPFGEAVVDFASDAYAAWSQETDEAKRRTEVETLAQASRQEVRSVVLQVVQEIASDQPEQVRQTVANYLDLVPTTIHRSLRRPADPTGTTVPASLVLHKPEDLLPFLPARLPRFKPGDRPLPGVDWELVELLGIGGFGEVWKARNPHFDGVPPVALKFCLDEAARDRLLRHEAATLNQVMRQGRHPGIVALLHTYLRADPPCLEYEYVEGGDLAGLLQDSGGKDGLAPADAFQVMQQLAEPIAFAHRLKPAVVHRDLKPANILVGRSAGGKLSFKVADFGIGGVAAGHALAEVAQGGTNRSQFLTTALRGSHTPLYASLQQKRGEPPDPRDDVYALGVIWYQLLTGDLGAEAPSGRVWPQRLQDRGASEAMIDLLAACIEPRVEDRLASAADLAERLAALSATAPPPTVTPAPAPPARKQEKPEEITNSLDMEFVRIPAGRFLMGCPEEEGEAEDQGPPREVEITKPFYLGAYPVTQEQYEQVMGTNPSYFAAGGGGSSKVKGLADTRELPVEHVSWADAVEFCCKLSALPEEQAAGRVYELPTEAEWEYACRAGTATPFHFGAELNGRQANCDGRYPYGTATKGPNLKRPCVVGMYPPNAWGLHDLHGNVWEWCSDWYSEDYYERGENKDPQGPKKGENRVLRGGSWYSPANDCRAAFRSWDSPSKGHFYAGFRVRLRLD